MDAARLEAAPGTMRRSGFHKPHLAATEVDLYEQPQSGQDDKADLQAVLRIEARSSVTRQELVLQTTSSRSGLICVPRVVRNQNTQS
jgi:hypothetical protein